MNERRIAARSPQVVQLEKGQTYAWCACGRSANQPWCDGSHRGTGFRPHVFKAEETGEAWMCRCKHTNGVPFCDGTHNTLPADADT